MRILLDTHVLLWWLEDPAMLSAKARKAIESGNKEVLVSVISLWEMSIKKKIGKLNAPGNIDHVMKVNRFDYLPLLPEHIAHLDTLPSHHRDPFDRALVAQALCEKCLIITRDHRILQYDIDCIEA